MSSLSAQTLYTPEEYISLERKATLKSEYLSGEILAMSGASLSHTRITLDIATELNIQLRGQECEVVTNDMRVKTTPIISYFYPDVVVFCGEPEFEDDTLDTLLNPVLIIEVLSPSTEAYDRGEKFEYYKQIASLKEYILVSQDKVHVEHYQLQDTEWKLKTFHELQDTLSLPSTGCKLSLSDIYTRVNLD
ncbi:Uma2 family endonuclease [Candidatus Poribacteria bacterium]|nr:Uma2 family endonuclease [Candidatus Poribacteria bacterium]